MSASIASETPTLTVLAVLPPGQEAVMIRRLLAEEGIEATVRQPSHGAAAWADGTSCRAILVDESLEPAAIHEALEGGWILPTAPLFVLTRRLPDRDRYIAWLEAGAWDLVKMPLESMALALRLRNILRGAERLHVEGPKPARYQREALLRVADESIALAHRHGRSLHCVAVALDAHDQEYGPAMLERLADATQRLVRRSDLIGVGEHTLYVLLPDTEPDGGRTFTERLQRFLCERLEDWGVAAAVRTGFATAAPASTGRELLETAARGL